MDTLTQANMNISNKSNIHDVHTWDHDKHEM